MKLIIFILSLLVGQALAGETYFMGQGGYLKLNQEAASKNNVNPTGLSYGGGVGIRQEAFELEASFVKSTAEADLKHDGKSNTMVHEQSSFILALNLYLYKYFYARLGYGFHKINQELKTPVSNVSQEGANKAYDLQSNVITEGLIIGGGLVLYRASTWSAFGQIDHMDFSTFKAGAWNTSIGLKFFFN